MMMEVKNFVLNVKVMKIVMGMNFVFVQMIQHFRVKNIHVKNAPLIYATIKPNVVRRINHIV